jgi:hypothetical protein
VYFSTKVNRNQIVAKLEISLNKSQYYSVKKQPGAIKMGTPESEAKTIKNGAP